MDTKLNCELFGLNRIAHFHITCTFALQYLEFNTFKKTSAAFEKECSEKGKPSASSENKPRTNQKLQAVQVSSLCGIYVSYYHMVIDIMWNFDMEMPNQQCQIYLKESI